MLTLPAYLQVKAHAAFRFGCRLADERFAWTVSSWSRTAAERPRPAVDTYKSSQGNRSTWVETTSVRCRRCLERDSCRIRSCRQPRFGRFSECASCSLFFHPSRHHRVRVASSAIQQSDVVKGRRWSFVLDTSIADSTPLGSVTDRSRTRPLRRALHLLTQDTRLPASD